MNDQTIKKRFGIVLVIMLICTAFIPAGHFSPEQHSLSPKNGKLLLTFINTANGKPIVLRDSVYTNYFGETYTVNKLKYYISNISLTETAGGKMHTPGGYFLVNAASDENSFDISLSAGKYNKLTFLLGVDSVKNCSGAQDGALDPLNDMFWTWNSGYVMFKLEGNSSASTADLNRIEHHLGGYKGPDKVITDISLEPAAGQLLEIKENTTTEIIIETNMDNYWNGNKAIRISETPVCITSGAVAKKISGNFKSLFTIKSIKITQ